MSCCSESNKPDYMLRWLALAWTVCAFLYWGRVGSEAVVNFCGNVFRPFYHSIWTIFFGIVNLTILNAIPGEFVLFALGNNRPGKPPRWSRALLAGVILDLCNHGILMVAAKLYRRGASLGQTMAFLIASPWNSLSVFLVMASFIGWGYAWLFLFLSLLVGWLAGFFIDMYFYPYAKQSQLLTTDKDEFDFWQQAKHRFKMAELDELWYWQTVKNGFLDSRMVLRWLLLGCFISAAMHGLLGEQGWQRWFSPDLSGLLATLGLATVVEVCAEGSLPVANDIFHQASAVGNCFCFLMAGACTDLTEILVLRSSTRSWSKALMLPLVSVPVVLLIAMILNMFPPA